MRAARAVFGALMGVIAVLNVAVAPPAASQVDAPSGFVATRQVTLAAGVEYAHFEAQQTPLSVHIARIHPHAAADLRPVLSSGRIDGGLEPTSAMCQRVQCLVAVNADFHHADIEQPVGGLIVDGVMKRSPVPSHHQVSITADRQLVTGGMQWSGQVMPSDLRPLAITGVNVPRGPDGLVAYTPAFGPTTKTNPHGHEVVLRIVEPADAALRVGRTALAEVVAVNLATGESAIPPDGIVLSAHGTAADALADLDARIRDGRASDRMLVRIEVTPAVLDSVGGSPILVRDGRRFVGNDGSSFVAGRHPRTLLGWTATDEVLLVTADGRQPGKSVGMTLAEAADFMIALGAVQAINLDGGGSTTFAAGGQVLNRPSDGAERPVSVALAVVAGAGTSPPVIDPLQHGAGLGTPQELALGVHDIDPASDPTGALPPRVLVAPSPPPSVWPPASAAAALLAAVATALATTAGTRARRPARGRPARRPARSATPRRRRAASR